MCHVRHITSKIQLFFIVYDRTFTIYENVIVSGDIHSTVFVFLNVHSTARAVNG